MSRASEARPDDPEILSDLGAAYAVRGETEQRKSDYQRALDLFLKALTKRPTEQRDLFNLALTYEHLSLPGEALDIWTKLVQSTTIHAGLRITPSTLDGWRREAEIHRTVCGTAVLDVMRYGR